MGKRKPNAEHLSIKFYIDGQEYGVDIDLPDTLEGLHFFHFDLRDCLYYTQIEILEKKFNLTRPFKKGLIDRLQYYDN